MKIEYYKVFSHQIYISAIIFYILTLILGNIVFCKTIFFLILNYELQVPAGALFYPITFLMADFVTEIYGKRKAQAMIFWGLFANVYVFLGLAFVDGFKTASSSALTAGEFHRVFQNSMLSFIASTLAYFISQQFDVFLYALIKKITNEKFLWLRNNVSTIMSQCIDSFFYFFTLYVFGVYKIGLVINIFGATLMLKVIFAFLSTPLLYFMVWVCHRYVK